MSPLTRRRLIGTSIAAGAAATVFDPSLSPVAAAPAAGDPGVDLHWLDGPPGALGDAAWGVPWPRGQLRRGTQLALTTSDGQAVPVQSWPLATWPDGSLKWTG